MQRYTYIYNIHTYIIYIHIELNFIVSNSQASLQRHRVLLAPRAPRWRHHDITSPGVKNRWAKVCAANMIKDDEKIGIKRMTKIDKW